MIDGVPITDMVNRPALLPTMEALEDIKVQVHTYDAEMGRTGGGVFNVTAKSGTNAFHAGGLYQNRPEWGMANSFFNVRTGIPKQPGLFFNAYAGSFGGPIVRNKTFFWVASEGYRDNSAWNGQLILPTDAERNGDFSQTVDQSGNLVLIYDPFTTRPDGNGGYIREPFPGNRIPADRINPVARNITNYLDHVQVQRSGADGRANFSGAATLSNQADSATVKVEHKFSDNSSLTGAYLYSHTNEPFQVFFQQHPELDPGWNIVRRRPKVLALNNTHVLSSTTVLTLRAGWMSFPSFGTPGSADFDMAGLGFPASFVNAVSAQKFPRINVLGFGQVGGNALIGDAGYAFTRDSSYNFNGTMSKLIGRHTVKVGGDFRDLHRRSAGLGQSAGTFQFDQGWTQSVPGAASRANNGNSFASFLLGLPTANTSLGSSVPINTPLDFFVRYESGFPVNVVQLTDNTGSFSGTQRPNWTGTSPATAGSAIDRLDTYLGAAAYSLAPAFTFGSGPRTDPRVRTPFRTNYDVSISKNIPIIAGLNADIRAEMLNATNSPKFVGPETRLGTAQFGKITQQAGLMRITQLMLRIKW